MTFDLHISAKQGVLTPPELAQLKTAVQKGVDHIGQFAPLDGIDLTVLPTEVFDGPLGDPYCSGMAVGSHAAYVMINMRHPGYDPARIPGLIVHELHHCLRWPHVPAWTVADVIVLEGLARCAEAEINPGEAALYGPPPDSLPLDRLRQTAGETHPDTRNWIYDCAPGCHSAVMYHLGYALVSAALRAKEKTPYTALDWTAHDLLHCGIAAFENA